MDNSALVQALLDGPQTGVALAEHFGVTRAAVWKRIDHLRGLGLAIEARGQQGYALAAPTPLLDATRIRTLLEPAARADIAGLHVLFETDSTQHLAMAHPSPEQGIDVWLAETQRVGQGRRGKAWVSPPLANIHCSVNRRFVLPMAAMAGFPLACAVILADALRAQGIDGLGVKWPNDLWLHGRKCAGLLIQLRGEAQGPCEVTLGFGINVNMPPAAGTGIDQDWTALAHHYGAFDRNILLAALLPALAAGFVRYQREGLAGFAPRWHALDVLAGRPIRILAAEGAIDGRALGIDSDGALRVASDAGIERRFHSGEVSVRRIDG